MDIKNAEKTVNSKWERFVSYVKAHPKTGIAICLAIGIAIAWFA
jgi:hypothetical protein